MSASSVNLKAAAFKGFVANKAKVEQLAIQKCQMEFQKEKNCSVVVCQNF